MRTKPNLVKNILTILLVFLLIATVTASAKSIPQPVKIPPVASFTCSPKVVHVGGNVHFTDTSTPGFGHGKIVGRAWYINNLMVSQAHSFIYSFDVAGRYSVKLKIGTADDTTASTIGYVTVKE